MVIEEEDETEEQIGQGNKNIKGKVSSMILNVLLSRLMFYWLFKIINVSDDSMLVPYALDDEADINDEENI